MKYVVTGMSISRKYIYIEDKDEYQKNGYKVNTYEDGKITRDEIIDTETNSLFKNCKDVWEIEERYESRWNRLNNFKSLYTGMNDGYVNHEIVKVLDVTPFKEKELFYKILNEDKVVNLEEYRKEKNKGTKGNTR